MPPPTDPPSTITLRVKVPPGHIAGNADEFTLGTAIPIASTIGQVRQRIQEAVPSAPSPERQRLLYAGRALVDNEQTIADALNVKRDTTQTEYVVHLLVRSDASGIAPTPQRRSLSRSASPAVHATGAVGDGPPPQRTGQQAQGQAPQHVHQQHIPFQHVNQHQAAVQAAVLAQQQRLQAQMMQNAGQNRFMPPVGGFGGTPHMNFGGQIPGWGPQHQQYGMPGIPPAGFQQAVGQGQQQRAANGMQGVGTEHNAHQQPENGRGAAQHNEQVHTDGATEVGQGQGQNQTQPSPSQVHAGQPQAPPPHPHRRPLGNHGFLLEGIAPNGDRVTVHQQTLTFPNSGIPGQQVHLTPQQLLGLGQAPAGLPPLPGMIQQQHGPTTPNNLLPRGASALNRARDNLTEMRQMLEELRNVESNTEAQAARIRRLQEQMHAVHDYIDPLRNQMRDLRERRDLRDARSTSQPPPHGTMPPWQQRPPEVRLAQQLSQSTVANNSRSDVTCYLLSSPAGPQALLYTPQHGVFTGTMPLQTAFSQHTPNPTLSRSHSHPTGAIGQPQQNQQQVAQQPPDQIPAQQDQAQAREPNPLGPLAPIINHIWLLLRIMIFAYFLLGADMGWRRPLALGAIGLGFWMIRAGLLGDGGAVRRWWEGIVQDGRRPAEGQRDGNAPQQGREGNAAQGAVAGQMPTPEQVAQRLLDEDGRVRNERVQWLRERIRPVERAVALLVASLWPGVGEAYVRAREQEERRKAEEEVAAARRAEEEKQRLEDEKKEKEAEGEGEGEGSSEKERRETSPESGNVAQGGHGANDNVVEGGSNQAGEKTDNARAGSE